MGSYKEFKNEIIENQFSYEFNVSKEKIRNKENIFSSRESDENFRFWANSIGNILIYNEKILVRLENELALSKIKNEFSKVSGSWFFEEENIKYLEKVLNEQHLTIINRAPFFIPKVKMNYQKEENFKIYTQKEIRKISNIEDMDFIFSFEEGLYEDKIGLGYFDGEKLIAMAGANEMSPVMWEIGIMKFSNEKKYRGIGQKLLQNITALIQEKNILPVYGTQFSHIKSINLAIRAGYELGWVELMIGELD